MLKKSLIFLLMVTFPFIILILATLIDNWRRDHIQYPPCPPVLKEDIGYKNKIKEIGAVDIGDETCHIIEIINIYCEEYISKYECVGPVLSCHSDVKMRVLKCPSKNYTNTVIRSQTNDKFRNSYEEVR